MAFYQIRISTEKCYIIILKEMCYFIFFPQRKALQVQSHIQLYTTEQNNRIVHQDKFCAHLIETLAKKLEEQCISITLNNG